MEKQIDKPLLDSRHYKAVTLSNSLEALLVEDKSTTLSSASLAVHAGYYDDPEDLPGLAHFCEHLMFLGTKKYPQENGYKQFILTNSGASNAFTSTQITNYHFQVKNSAFPEAVDRFAQFFIEPLFDPDCKDREINAVNSEHEKNIQLDTRRTLHVARLTANHDHPYHKFSTGSKATLGKDNVRERLLEFHRDKYCASKMKLVLMGNDLSELESLVSVFDDILNKGLPLPVIDAPILNPNVTSVHITPLSERRFLRYEFQVPGWNECFESSTASYYSSLLGHESPGSLYWDLKDKGWAESVSASVNHVSRSAGLLQLSVTLTKEGLQHCEEIGEAVFEYLGMLAQNGPQAWYFEEAKAVARTRFNYKDPPSQPMSETSALSAYFCGKWSQPEDVVGGAYLMRNYDETVLNKFINVCTPDNLRVVAVAPEYEDMCKLAEPHTGAKYQTGKLPESMLERFATALRSKSTRFHLPAKNPYIAQDFSILNKKQDVPLSNYYKPTTLLPTLSYFPDLMFETPKGVVYAGMIHPDASSSCRYTLLTQLTCALWMDAAEKYSYDAGLAGLNLSFNHSRHGISVRVTGFNDKLHVFLTQAWQTLSSEIDAKRFPIILDRLRRGLVNKKFSSPFQTIGSYLSVEVEECSYSLEEKLECIKDDITLEEVETHVKRLLDGFTPRVLVAGNLSEQKAHEIHNELVKKFDYDCDTAPTPKQFSSMPISGSRVVSKPSLNPDGLDNCVLYYLETSRDPKDIASARLLGYIIKEPAFTFLRTKKQLGYVARASFERNTSTAGISLLTQSAYKAEDVENLMTEFLAGPMTSIFEKMTAEEFENYTTGFVTQVSKPPKSIITQSSQIWTKMLMNWGFTSESEAVKLAENVTLDEMRRFYENITGPDRKKLSIQIKSAKESKRYECSELQL